MVSLLSLAFYTGSTLESSSGNFTRCLVVPSPRCWRARGVGGSRPTVEKDSASLLFMRC